VGGASAGDGDGLGELRRLVGESAVPRKDPSHCGVATTGPENDPCAFKQNVAHSEKIRGKDGARAEKLRGHGGMQTTSEFLKSGRSGGGTERMS